MKYLQTLSILILPAILSACAGSSSSTSSTSTTVTPSAASFTSWSTYTPGTAVGFTDGSTSAISASGSVSQSDSAGSATLTLDGGGTATAISATNGATTANFSAANGDTLVSGFGGATTLALNKSQTSMAVFANPTNSGYEYQTFGAWGAYGNGGASGAISVGNVTPLTGLPTSGTGAFVGGSSGYYIDPSNNAFLVNSTLNINVDFAGRTASFSTSNSAMTGGPTGSAIGNSNLNLSGNLSYGAGSTNLSGTVTSTSGMTGPANAKFYGPVANEIGGTYAVSGSGLGSMVGGFGGKR